MVSIVHTRCLWTALFVDFAQDHGHTLAEIADSPDSAQKSDLLPCLPLFVPGPWASRLLDVQARALLSAVTSQSMRTYVVRGLVCLLHEAACLGFSLISTRTKCICTRVALIRSGRTRSVCNFYHVCTPVIAVTSEV